MKKTYKTPALRESELNAMTLLAGSDSLGVNTTKGKDNQLSKRTTIFDSVFSPAEDEE